LLVRSPAPWSPLNFIQLIHFHLTTSTNSSLTNSSSLHPAKTTKTIAPPPAAAPHAPVNNAPHPTAPPAAPVAKVVTAMMTAILMIVIVVVAVVIMMMGMDTEGMIKEECQENEMVEKIGRRRRRGRVMVKEME